VILASVWKTLGYNLLFYIAGLQTVPDDQLEAADARRGQLLAALPLRGASRRCHRSPSS
jgi:hypothetical protein